MLGGLPGTGKTTLARLLARSIGAVYLRIDVIEQALASAGLPAGPAGYLVGYALAESNLALGRAVVADCVNPLGITRAAWRETAGRAGAEILEIEVVCSDQGEHRRRVESRQPDLPGHILPNWEDVQQHDYAMWNTARLVVDTAANTVEWAGPPT